MHSEIIIMFIMFIMLISIAGLIINTIYMYYATQKKLAVGNVSTQQGCNDLNNGFVKLQTKNGGGYPCYTYDNNSQECYVGAWDSDQMKCSNFQRSGWRSLERWRYIVSVLLLAVFFLSLYFYISYKQA